MARIDKFRKDYASRMGGVRLYPCLICKKGSPTRHALIGHLFAEHGLDAGMAILLAGGSHEREG